MQFISETERLERGRVNESMALRGRDLLGFRPLASQLFVQLGFPIPGQTWFQYNRGSSISIIGIVIISFTSYIPCRGPGHASGAHATIEARGSDLY